MGFCFGVKRAIEMTEKALASGETVYIVGDLIHNKAVIERLARKGLKRISNLDEIPAGRKAALVIRAHGVPRETYVEAEKLGLKLIDATCPFVKKAQLAASQLAASGYHVIIIGDREHSEVKGLLSAAGEDSTVVSSLEELEGLELPARIGVVFQTTQPIDAAGTYLAGLFPRCAELDVHNTICNATFKRQDAVSKLAPRVDAMVIVGDRHSANTKRLTNIASELNPRTIQVESASELERAYFEGAHTVGVSAGASTPDWLIERVVEILERW